MNDLGATGVHPDARPTDPRSAEPPRPEQPPIARTGDAGAALLALSAALGTAATAYLVVAGTTLGAHLTAARLWFYDSPGAVSAGRLGFGRALGLTDVALGVLALAWVLAGLALRRGASFRALLIVGLCWALPLLVGPPLFSPDVYTYAAVGASVQHGVNPFLHGPGVLGNLPALRGAEPFWRNSPSPYSPPFVAGVAGLSGVLDERLLAVVVALRALALGAWACLVVLVRRVVRRRGGDPRWALWLGLVNPLVLLTGLSAAHSDLVMALFLLAAVWLVLRGQPLWAAVCCAAAADVKAVAVVGVAIVAVDAAARASGGPWSRLRRLITTAGVGCGVFVLTVEACGWGWAWVHDLSVPGKAVEPLSPPTALALVLDTAHPPLVMVRRAALLLAALACLVLLTRVRRWGVPRVMAWALFALLVLAPAFWPWYLLAPTVLWAVSGTRGERVLAGALSVALLFVVLPGGQPVLSLLPQPWIDQVVVAVVGGLVVVGLLAVWSARNRRRWAGNWVAEPAGGAASRVLVVTPTYDEAENVARHVEGVLARPVRPDVLIVDDSSPDGTGDLVRELVTRHPGRVHLLERSGRLGLGSAYVAGFRWALADGRWDVVVQMDVDGSHEARSIDDLVARTAGADLVLGSRYVPGGRVVNWPLRRRVLSCCGNRYARAVTGLPVHDLTGGFKAWRVDLLARMDIGATATEGYGFQIETTARAAALGAAIAEVPIEFPDRTVGHSKMTGGIALEALVAVWRIRAGLRRRPADPPAENTQTPDQKTVRHSRERSSAT